MIKNLLKQLWLPVLSFAALVYGWMLATGKFGELHRDVPSEVRQVILYALQTGLWLVGAWAINRLISVVVWGGLATKRFNGNVPRLLRDVTSLLLLLFAVTGIVGWVFQYSVAGIWATSGAVGIVLGIALKDVILDVFTGLAVNIDRPFVIGDWIRIPDGNSAGLVGQVLEIHWRTTRLRSEDNLLVVIPNSTLSNMIITNFDQPTQPARFEVLMQIESWVPVERTRRVLLASLLEVTHADGVLADPAPSVLVNNTSNSGIEFRLLFWITPWRPLTPNRARDLVQATAIKHLSVAGIPLAFPKTDITFKRADDIVSIDSLDYRRQLLETIHLFRNLPREDLGFLAENLRYRDITTGEVVIHQGDPGDSMFVLSEGLLRVLIDPRSHGAPICAAFISPGEFFGEMSLLTGEARSATIQVESSGRMYELRKDCLSDLFRRQPQLLDSISQVVAERRMENDHAQQAAAEIDKNRHTASLAEHFNERIRNFFRGIISG